MTTIRLDAPPGSDRTRVVLRKTTRTSVDLKARVITGYSVIALGEALGHGLWIDEEMLSQVTKAGLASGDAGIKSRFTHPDMSNDGLGKHLGRTRGFVRDGDQVRGDLHVADVADRSPDGKLGSYVLELAAEDPEAFGSSIVFERDLEQERAFALKHGAVSSESGYIDFSTFRSPDKRNARNLRHCRLKALEASDMVGDPAANPDGLFSGARAELFAQLSAFDEAAAYVLGLSDIAPSTSFGGIHPQRAREFVTRFLDQRGKTLAPKETTMSTSTSPASAALASAALDAHASPAPAPPATDSPATIEQLEAAHPGRPDFVVAQLKAKATLTQAAAAFSTVRIAELEAERDGLKSRNAELAAGKAGKNEPAPSPAKPRVLSGGRQVPGVADADAPAFGGDNKAEGGGDFLEMCRAYRDEKHPELAGDVYGRGMNEAIDATRKSHPDAYASYRQSHGIPGARRAK